MSAAPQDLQKRKHRISIVSPAYNEVDNVEACYRAVRDEFDTRLPEYDHEHIFADNASTDGTADALRRIAEQDPRVKVVLNARNYGPFRSTFNALRYATGDAVLVMLPVDLQDPPELIPEFVRLWEQGAKIVRGERRARDESLFWRLVRRAYYCAVNRIADIEIPANTAEFQLIDRRVWTELMAFHDHYPYIRGMIANCGFADETRVVPYRWKARRSGLSKNRVVHLVDQGLNGLVSFSTAPLRAATLVGFLTAAASIAYGALQLAINLVLPAGSVERGIPTLIVAMFVFAGVQLFFVGLLGEYIGAIHELLRRGDRVIERERINLGSGNPPAPGGTPSDSNPSTDAPAK